MRKQTKKKILWVLIVITIALIMFATVGNRAGWFGRAGKIKVSIEKAQYRNIIETITANGKIQPETEVKISSDVSGEIVELHVIEGQEVKESDLLLKINPDIYLSSIERIEATLNSSNANLANAKARLVQVEAQFKKTEQTWVRNKKLWEQKAISESDYETAQSAFEMGKAEVDATVETVKASEFSVKSTEASLKEARENLDKTTIYAPVDGTVTMLNVEKGERVVGTMQMAGTEMLRIANLDVMEVVVDVNENDIVRVSFDDTALIEADAYLDKKFKGLVTEIANSAKTAGLASDQVTSFEVKIRILRSSYQDLIPKDNPNYCPFRPGMSATVDIQTHRVFNVLSVPIQAVTTRAENDTAAKSKGFHEFNESDEWEKQENNVNFTKEKAKTEEEKMLEVVFIIKEGIAGIREVKTGIQDNNYIEILHGLSTAEDIVVSPYSAISKRLRNKAKVEVVKKEELFSFSE